MDDDEKENTENQAPAGPVDLEDVQVAWENLDVARLIIERRINAEDIKEEEKKSLTKKLALIHQRLGGCMAWQDDFILAIEEHN